MVEIRTGAVGLDHSQQWDPLAAARAVADDLAERADQHDRDGSYAPENIEALWRSGLGNLTLPVDEGGPGANLTTTAKAVEIIAGGDPSTALIWIMHLSQLRLLATGERPWPERLRRQVIDESLRAPALINALRVEPELGTPARGGIPATTAVRTTSADGQPAWSISGHKIYSTGSSGLRWMVVWAATTPDDPDGQRVGSFLVRSDTPGIEIRSTWDHLGMRASASHDVVFSGAVVPLDHALALSPPGGPGGAPPAVIGSSLTVLLLALYLGVAKTARTWLARYLNERVPTNLGAPLASLPRFQSAVGEIEALLFSADRLLYGLAADLDAGGELADAAARQISLAKVVVTNNAIRSVEQGMALIGNPGLSHRNPLQRHYRDVLCSRIHTPQDDTVLLAAGKSALGL